MGSHKKPLCVGKCTCEDLHVIFFLSMGQPRPQGFSLKKMGGAGKGPGIGWSRAQPKYS